MLFAKVEKKAALSRKVVMLMMPATMGRRRKWTCRYGQQQCNASYGSIPEGRWRVRGGELSGGVGQGVR